LTDSSDTTTSPVSAAERHGGCLCGAVRYRLKGSFAQPAACHCHMCRRHHGALGVFVGTQRDAVEIRGAEHILWFSASPGAERGSCRICGSKLSWRESKGTAMDMTVGSLDRRDDLVLTAHIWVDHRGDYEDLADELPKYAASSRQDGAPVAPLGTLTPLASPATERPPYSGGCLCGHIRFEVTVPLREVVVCHCAQCQHWHGYAGAYCLAPIAAMTIHNGDDIRWYAGSPELRRGFCPDCGSCLFSQGMRGNMPAEQISISAGALDAPSGLKTGRQLFLSEGAAPYRMSEGLIRAASGWSSPAPAF